MSKKRRKPVKKRRKPVKKAVRTPAKPLKIRPRRVRDVISDLRRTHYDVKVLQTYYNIGEITRAEFDYIARRLAKEVLRYQQYQNYAVLRQRIKTIRYYIRRNWRTRAVKAVQQFLAALPQYYKEKAVYRPHYLLLHKTLNAMARKLHPRHKAPSPFKPLTFQDLRLLVVKAMKAGELVTADDLLFLKAGAIPADYKRFIQKYELLIQTYNALIEAAVTPYYWGEFTPCGEVYQQLKRRYNADIKLGRRAPIWTRLWMINDETNPLYTLLAKGPYPSLRKIMRKTNNKAKSIYIFALFEWISPSEHPTYDLERGDLVIWGHKWSYNFGKKPYDYIQKVYRPRGLLKKTTLGGWRDVSQLEDTYNSRFINSSMLRFKQFLGLYIPIVK